MWVSIRHCSSVPRFPFKQNVGFSMIWSVSSGPTGQFHIEKPLLCCILAGEGGFCVAESCGESNVA